MDELNNDYFLEEEKEEEDLPLWRKILLWSGKIFIVFILISSLFYIYGGVRELFLYRETPSGINQVSTESKVDGPNINIPLNIIVVRSDSDGSQLQRDDVYRMVENASNIWKQGRIDIFVDNIREINVSSREADMFLRSPNSFLEDIEGYDPDMINIVLIRRLSGINGIAFSGLNTAGVADLSTIYNFRVLAHEIGHILGLGHVDLEKSRLMHSEANGFDISVEELNKARNNALEFQVEY